MGSDVDSVVEWFTNQGFEYPWKRESRGWREKLLAKISDYREGTLDTKTKIQKSKRNSIDGKPFRRTKNAVTNTYISQLQNLIAVEDEETQEYIVLQLLESYIPGSNACLKIIKNQSDVLKHINSTKSKIQTNSEKSMIIKRNIFASSAGENIALVDMEAAFDIKINRELFKESKSMNQKFRNNTLDSFIENWHEVESPFDNPKIKLKMYNWHYEPGISEEHHANQRVLVRNVITGAKERITIQVMLKSDVLSHQLFCEHPDYGAQCKRICGRIPCKDTLKANRPPECRWLKDPSRAIDRFIFLFTRNFKEFRNTLLSLFGKETIGPILPEDGIIFLKTFICKIPTGDSSSPDDECDSFFNCLDGLCHNCSAVGYFTSIWEEEDFESESETYLSEDDIQEEDQMKTNYQEESDEKMQNQNEDTEEEVASEVDGEDEEQGEEDEEEEEEEDHEEEEKEEPVKNKKRNDAWGRAQKYKRNSCFWRKFGIEIPRNEIISYWAYENKIKYSERKKKQITIEIATKRQIPAFDFFAKFEKLITKALPHIIGTQIQGKAMWMERKVQNSVEGTVVHTSDFMMKMQVMDGMVQTQTQFRSGENFSGETYYTVCKPSDVKFTLRSRKTIPERIQLMGIVLSDNPGSNTWCHGANLEKWLFDKEYGIHNLVEVKNEIFQCDGPTNTYKNSNRLVILKKHAVRTGHDCSGSYFLTGGGKGPWDGFGGNTKYVYKTQAQVELQTEARPTVVKWFRINRSIPLRIRENSYEMLIYHWNNHKDVVRYEENFEKKKTIYGPARQPVIRMHYHFVVTADPDDPHIYTNRFSCGQQCSKCRACKWLECERQYICGKYIKCRIPNWKRKPTTAKSEDIECFKRTKDGKFICKYCGGKSIGRKSIAAHLNSKKHTTAMSDSIM